MNKIGFKNFRKFTDFPTIDLGGITILVGGNNAGKSTLVKAMLLMRDFLKSRIEGANDNIFSTFVPQFKFDTEHVNIGEFFRAFCRNAPDKEDTITFTMGIENYLFEVDIRGERKPGVIPEVAKIALTDEKRDVFFEFDFFKRQMSVRFVYDREALNSQEEEKRSTQETLSILNERLKYSSFLDEILNLKQEIEQNEKRLMALSSDYETEEYDLVTIDMSIFMGNNIGKLLIPELIKGFANYAEIGTTGDKRSKKYKDTERNKNILKGKTGTIVEISEELENILNKQVAEYIYAHSVEQTTMYANCIGSRDYTERTIHEFYNSRITSDEEEFSFLEKWLKEFKIGSSLRVIPYTSDSYGVYIIDGDNPDGIDLADKGMGSIQLVILLLRLVTLIHKYKGQKLTVILEEPEQNLHPALQSELAKLFKDIYKNYGFIFIIETHSEYLIRKTQVIVADINNSIDRVNNPFKVYYLPDDGKEPYEMIYRSDGKFSNQFGPGFFDEAANLAFKIF